MYTQENVYIHIKLLKQNRDARKNMINYRLDLPLPLKNQIENDTISKKSLWKPNSSTDGKFLLKLVELFIKETEKIWPFNKIPFSEECALEYLLLNEYNVENTITKIQNLESDFLEYVNKKISLFTNDLSDNIIGKKKKYSLRCKKN